MKDHTTHFEDCGCQYAALNALLVKQRADFAKEVDALEARIATLEAELAEARTARGDGIIADLNFKLITEQARAATLEAELAAPCGTCAECLEAVAAARVLVAEQIARANALRDALEKANAAFNAWGRDEDGIHPEAWPAVEHLREVLLATPAASLAALKAEVLERARLAINAADPDCQCGNISIATSDSVFRALAAQAATHSELEVKP